MGVPLPDQADKILGEGGPRLRVVEEDAVPREKGYAKVHPHAMGKGRIDGRGGEPAVKGNRPSRLRVHIIGKITEVAQQFPLVIQVIGPTPVRMVTKDDLLQFPSRLNLTVCQREIVQEIITSNAQVPGFAVFRRLLHVDRHLCGSKLAQDEQYKCQYPAHR